MKAKSKLEPQRRTFLSKAYLKEVERGTFGLFRDLVFEEADKKTGSLIREKSGKPIGPIRLLREARKGEENRVVMRTMHPKTGKAISLVEDDPA